MVYNDLGRIEVTSQAVIVAFDDLLELRVFVLLAMTSGRFVIVMPEVPGAGCTLVVTVDGRSAPGHL